MHCDLLGEDIFHRRNLMGRRELVDEMVIL